MVRPFARWWVAVVVGLAVAGPTAARQPAPPPVPVNPLGGYQPGDPPPAVPEAFPIPAPPAEAPGRWQADLLVGLPTAVRVRRQLGESRAWLEAGAGLYVIFPVAFVGLRFDAPLLSGRRDDLLVRPGVSFVGGLGIDATDGRHWRAGSNASAFGMVAADFDLVWRHRYTERFHGEFGLQLGAAAFVVPTNPWFPVLPVGGVVVGFRY
jgi:hypothetical protein